MRDGAPPGRSLQQGAGGEADDRTGQLEQPLLLVPDQSAVPQAKKAELWCCLSAVLLLAGICVLGLMYFGSDVHRHTSASHQCAQHYLNISDVWRSVFRDCGGGGCPKLGCSPPDGPPVNCSCRPGGPATGSCSGDHRDKGGPGGHWSGDAPLGSCSGTGLATGVGGNRWYRFVGEAGDALPLKPPGVDHCGASLSGWLSGWSGSDLDPPPPRMYKGAGKYPVASDGVVERTACFNHGPPNANTWCLLHSSVGVVRCDPDDSSREPGFFLFRLSYSGSCGGGYCAAHSNVVG
jgi:hypothetical protein